MNQHQAAIWGAGGIAQTHAMALRAVGIPIRTVIGHSEAGARAFAEQWGIPEWSTDPAALLDASVGSVHVCTPPGLHYEMVKFLLEHGRHVPVSYTHLARPAGSKRSARGCRRA